MRPIVAVFVPINGLNPEVLNILFIAHIKCHNFHNISNNVQITYLFTKGAPRHTACSTLVCHTPQLTPCTGL